MIFFPAPRFAFTYIKVDENNEAGICEYCGTAFITEKVINNYYTSMKPDKDKTQKFI